MKHHIIRPRIEHIDLEKLAKSIPQQESPSKKPKDKPDKTKSPNAEAEQGYIYVPSINLYMAEERSFLGENWHKTHEELHKQNLRMPTIPEFIEFLKYLRDNSQNEKYKKIFNEITEVRDPWRGEHLDADFKLKKKQLYINYAHRTINGKLTPQNSEKLEDYLSTDKEIDLNFWLDNATPQGLPPLNCKAVNLYYQAPAPLKDNNFVAAGFNANSDRTLFNCNRNPSVRFGAFGVRAVRAP